MKRIERREAKNDPKPLFVKSGFSSKLGKSLQGYSIKNNSISNTSGPATSCSDRALERRALLLDKISQGQYYELGANQTIRISDLVGHGRYVQPSMSVRVSELLSVGAQLKQIRHPNVEVTVSDLLQQHRSRFQSFCQ